jgi:hypothetical protein
VEKTEKSVQLFFPWGTKPGNGEDQHGQYYAKMEPLKIEEYTVIPI